MWAKNKRKKKKERKGKNQHPYWVGTIVFKLSISDGKI